MQENANVQQSRADQPNQAQPTHSASQSSDLSLSFRGSSTTSAPTSPTKTLSSFLSRATSITGSVTSTVQQIARAATKDKQKILLVIDDHQTDWYVPLSFIKNSIKKSS